MKKKIMYVSSIVILLFCVAYFSIIPKGALRFAILRNGYLSKAFTYKISNIEVQNNHSIYTLSNPPVEKRTGGELRNWIIYKHSIFYWAEYYGEG